MYQVGLPGLTYAVLTAKKSWWDLSVTGFQHTKLSREISELFLLPVIDAIARNGKTQTVTEWNQ